MSKVSSAADPKNPYVSHQYMVAIKKKHTKWQKYLHNKSDPNHKIARNNVITELRLSKYNYEKDLAAKIKTDNKLFWSYVRSKMKTKLNIGQFELPDGSYTNDNQEKAEILSSYFASVFAVEGPEALPEFEDRNLAEPVANIDINGTNIAKAIDKLKASKSQCPDQIHPQLIKECKDSLNKPLEIIFKKSVENSQLLSIWKTGQCNSHLQKWTKNQTRKL